MTQTTQHKCQTCRRMVAWYHACRIAPCPRGYVETSTPGVYISLSPKGN